MASIASPQPALVQTLAQAAQAWQQGRFEHVVALLEPWDCGPRMHPQVLQLMGLARMRLGQLELAEDCQRRLVETAPSDVGAWINLANTQAALGRTRATMRPPATAFAVRASWRRIAPIRSATKRWRSTHWRATTRRCACCRTWWRGILAWR